MMLNIHIEPSRPELVESFRDCFDSIARERRFLGFAEAATLEQTRTFVANGLARGMVQYFAVSGQTVVGWCDVRPGAREGLTHTGTLGMGIRSGYRGQGIGSRLMEWSLNAAWSKGLTRVDLEVFTTNSPAIALYEKFGFQHEGVKRRGRLVDGVYDDVIVMGLLRNV